MGLRQTVGKTMFARRWSVIGVVAIALTAGVSGGVPIAIAHADPAPAADGMPSQAQTDLAASDPSNSMHSAGWADVAGGIAGRPYVSSLTIINGDVSTPVITNGDTTVPTTPTGGITTVISPFNLCQPGQTAAPGSCYASPNRVGVTLGYATGGPMGYNFANPSVPVTPTVDANTVFDMTVNLNSLGSKLSWTWINGVLLYWHTANLGENNATVHIKFHPAVTPHVTQFPAVNGCTATPMFNCDIPRADSEFLSASLFFSLEPGPTGAAFATQNAIAGLLFPGGTAAAPTLDIQASSTHTTSDGALQHGTIQAFIPAATLLNLYGILPGDATAAFTTTRAGDPGTNDAPTYTPWTTEANGSDGLLVTVTGITFSVPSYQVAGRLQPIASSARVVKKATVLHATVPGCSKRRNCRVTVYDLGVQDASRSVAKRKTVVTLRFNTAALALKVRTARLPRGHRFLLVVRVAESHKLIVSTLGTVR
jgi:hypothetical protein